MNLRKDIYAATGHVSPDYLGRPSTATTPWHDRILVLWEEDDATRGQDWENDGHENADRAFERITGHDPSVLSVLEAVDWGDAGGSLHRGGWVLGWSCEGGSVGVVVDWSAK